ncbi:hypothetical protein L0Y65_01145 [Candidatus Micrarchaeota archaeon]|nr:hypothetical protein [Candidatus Micrarchaeota archaeon]
MKLRAEKELQKPDGRPGEKPQGRRPMATLLSAAALCAVLAEGCNRCPVADDCNANDYEVTLAEGEKKTTVSNGLPVTVECLSISETVKFEPTGICRTYGGSAKIRLTIESDPPLVQEVDVSPSMCFSVIERCVAINDAEVSMDVEPVQNGLYDGDGGSGGSDAGGTISGSCLVSNEKVTFSLTIGE